MDIRQFEKNLPLIGGVLLVVLTVMCNAYWVEAVRWGDKADQAKLRQDSTDETRCVQQMNRAKLIFQVVAGLIFMTLVAILMPLLFPKTSVVSVVLHLISSASILVSCVIYMTGKFYVPLR